LRGPRADKGATSCRAEEIGRRLSALLTDTLRLVRTGRSPDWLKSKNPACEAAKREADGVDDRGRNLYSCSINPAISPRPT
jgi:hypothetical protein